MIDGDGYLTYTNKDPAILSYSFDNGTLNTFVIALLSTIVALQGAAAIFDLTLGFKKRGTLRIHDLHVFLLSTGLSALAVVDPMFRIDWITRKRFRGDIPKDTNIDREKRKIQPIVYIRLFLLLFIGPVLNIIIISLSLEAYQSYTFRDAGFGGLAIGANLNSQVQVDPESAFCFLAKVRYGKTDSALTTFHKCRSYLSSFDRGDVLKYQGAAIDAHVRSFGAIWLSVWNETDGLTIDTRGEIQSQGSIFYVKPEVSEKDLLDVVGIGLSELQKYCDANFERANSTQIPNELRVVYVGTCERLLLKQMIAVLDAMARVITFKNSSKFEIVSYQDLLNLENEDSTVPYFSADDNLFIRRTRGVISLIPLLITAVIIVILRILLRLFVAYNDFPVATEIVVRHGFGLLACDSMLQDDTVIEYRKKFQLLDKGHFGISSKDGLPEVNRLERGVVG